MVTVTSQKTRIRRYAPIPCVSSMRYRRTHGHLKGDQLARGPKSEGHKMTAEDIVFEPSSQARDNHCGESRVPRNPHSKRARSSR